MLRSKNLIVLATLLMFAFSALVAGGRDLRSAKLYSSQGKNDKALDYYLKYLAEADDLEDEDYIEALYAVSEIYFYEKVPSPDGTKIDLFEKAYEYYGKCVSTLDQIKDKVNLDKEKIDLKFEDENGKVRKMTFADVKHTSELKQSACIVRIYNLSLEFFGKEDYDQAAATVERLQALDPGYANAYLLLGNIALKQQDMDKAAENMLLAAQKEPERVELKETAASILFNLKRYQDAADIYTEMSTIQPDSVSHWMNLAICYVNMQNKEKAYENFKKVLEIDPANIEALPYAYNYSLDFKEPQNSVKYLEKMVELDPENTEYIISLSYKYYNEKMYDEVMTIAAKWHEMKPDEKEPVQLLYRAATELKNQELIKKYEAMLRKMQ